MNQGLFGLDRLSFWLGFLAASLLAFLAYRFRKYWPEILKFVQDKIKYYRQLSQAGVETVLRKDVLRRSQSSHLASPLFALDEIVIEPYLLVPPPQRTSDEEYHPRKYYPQAISYMPEAPEFAGQYGSIRLSLADSLQFGTKIAIVGAPGSGKTTALAYLASKITRRDPSVAGLNHLFPVLIHISDFPLSDVRTADPLDSLIKTVQYHIPAHAAAQCNDFLRKGFETDSVILLLDGLDELSPREFEHAYSYISTLLKKFPGMRVMVSAAPAQSARLLEIDIEPVAISGWNRKEIRDFVQKWCQAWNKNLGAEIETQTKVRMVDPLILSGLLCNDSLFHTPMEWVMKAWAGCAGNLKGSSSTAAIKAHVDRRLDPLSIRVAASLAENLLSEKRSTIRYPAAEKIAADVSSILPALSAVQPENPADSTPSTSIQPQISKSSDHPSSKSIITALETQGFILKHADDQLAFSNPLFCGYFASLGEHSPLEEAKPDLDWSAHLAYLQYAVAAMAPARLTEFLREEKSPILAKTILAAGWLRYLPASHASKTYLMRHLIQKIQSKDTTWNTRQKLAAQIATSNDLSVSLLFKQWLTSQWGELRVIAALGLGINQQNKYLQDIAACLLDPNAEVRYAACFALSIMDSGDAQKALWNALETGDEPVKMAAAEALAVQGSAGHDKLRQFYASEDILIRRVAIFGISQISSDWVAPFLEKVSTEDSQWVVRTAAGESIEHRQSANSYIPKPAPEPWNTSWLIKFASRSGASVSKQESPVPLLVGVLTTGTPEEHLAALWMMRKYQDPQLLKQAIKLLPSESLDVRETASYVLWQLLPAGSLSPFD